MYGHGTVMRIFRMESKQKQVDEIAKSGFVCVRARAREREGGGLLNSLRIRGTISRESPVAFTDRCETYDVYSVLFFLVPT
jgi:hypothetical protein